MIPTYILTVWLLGLGSFAMAGGAVWLGRRWYERSWGWDYSREQSIFAPAFGWNAPTALLAGALLLGFLILFGGPLLKAVLRLTKRSSGDPLRELPAPSAEQWIERANGSRLLVKTYGPGGAPAIVLTHGWGLNSDEWVYAYRSLGEHFRLITWDEAGLGRSSQPENRDFSLERMANDLAEVLKVAGEAPLALVGHSIGGMIILTYCRLFPAAARHSLAGLVLTHTTYTNPVRTTKGAALLTVLERPVVVPLLYLTIALSPLVWLMNWMSYRNGLAHLSSMRSSYAGTETWEQIDFAAHFTVLARPSILARGMLGMLAYDATETLRTITTPTLVVAGDQDSTCLPLASERMARDIPGAKLVTLSPAKHLGLIEHHARYAKEVQDFVQPVFRAQSLSGAVS